MTLTAVALRGLLLCVLLLQSLAYAEEATESLQEQELIVDATLTASMSGCGLCQTTGLCSHAFRGSPGQFCQTLVTGAPCCCPLGAQCVANAYACRCRTTGARSQSQPQVVVVNSGHNGSSSSSSGSSASTVIILMILGCCICCCCMSARKQQRESRQDSFYDGSGQYQYGAVGGGAHSPPVAYAVPQPGFGNIYPTAPPAYQDNDYDRYDHDQHNSNGKTYAAAAVGALGGLGVGALLGSTFGGGGGHQQQESSYFAGDTGGDYGNQTTSYEFSGDTGGDYGGDNGGDFAGDS